MSSTSDRTRRLVLLRHAKAERRGEHTDDEVRPLALEGRRQSGRVGRSLLDGGLVPELALVSPSVRTRQTWELVRGAFGDAATEVVLEDGLYAGGVTELVDLVRGTDERVRSVIVVGHEPTISTAAAALAGPDSDPAAVARVRVGVPTATYALLELDAHWDTLVPGGARLRAVVAPGE
jgi:phosphohistidine phosphatase